jgi:hypothetical protein
MAETQTVYGQFGEEDSLTGRRYTSTLNTTGIKNGMVMYVTGSPTATEINEVQAYVGYETATQEAGPWYTFVEFPIGREKDGRTYIFQYDLPVLLDVKTTGTWSNIGREVGSYTHSGASQPVRIGGQASIFQYVRGYISESIMDMDYVIRIY